MALRGNVGMKVRIIPMAGIAAGVISAVTSLAGAPQSAAGDPVAGKQVFARAVPQCSLCHKIGDRGGKLGPDLSDVGTKRDAAWLLKYLPNPQASNPKNKMPPVTVKGQDLTDLVAYLGSLKGKTAKGG
jgi:cytochrome c2